ncbi:hypothetical protein IC620_16625 [Hazenella sp. IB182357]|uniref:Uncharacterized protein n=1 Tax=Polycladospora coralii TaxID=2771432 RepID=A0A926N779_9BACL|nr:hypothetical protein [Polycladospora coralii]MBD1373969.1 hypothetical protein [Polycladospora coralii]MBS7532036.1 hypothetical protein [Polycladospora coralii]
MSKKVVITIDFNITIRYITSLQGTFPLESVALEVMEDLGVGNPNDTPEIVSGVPGRTVRSVFNRTIVDAWQGKMLVQKGVAVPTALSKAFPIVRVNYSPSLIHVAEALFNAFSPVVPTITNARLVSVRARAGRHARAIFSE